MDQGVERVGRKVGPFFSPAAGALRWRKPCRNAVLQEGTGTAHEIRESVLIPKRAAKRRFRQDIFEAWEHLCAYCAQPGADTLDHVVPKHKGGLTVRRNLVPACSSCNRRKGSEDWRTWFEGQEHHCEDRARRIDGWLNDTAPPIFEPWWGKTVPVED